MQAVEGRGSSPVGGVCSRLRGREGNLRNAREKEKVPSSCLLLYPGPCRSLYCSPGLRYLHSSFDCLSLNGGIAGNCSILLHGTEFGHLPGLGAEGSGEACQVHPDPDTLAAVVAYCSAGPVTSSARDLRVQI